LSKNDAREEPADDRTSPDDPTGYGVPIVGTVLRSDSKAQPSQYNGAINPLRDPLGSRDLWQALVSPDQFGYSVGPEEIAQSYDSVQYGSSDNS
jgi:hypothetical protein